ncbi:MAG: CBS domain-containing protein [Gammaproteobacteria bacterium]|nr:CBS domain-containing protein [Gammaproteobacteria bacterium]
MTGERDTAELSGWLHRLLGLFSREPQDRQGLIEILRNSEHRNLLDPDVLLILEGALHVSDLQVRDIMVPRVRMDMVQEDATPQEIIRVVVESGHSRFPVIGNDAGDVLGILLAKDLLACFSDKGIENFDIKDVMRPAVFIPESKRLNILLREFRASRTHMAVVVDEYGVAGVVTIEDVIEEIVGDIADEHDLDEEEKIRQHGPNRYTVQAITPIAEFNEFFRTSLDAEGYDTIGGLIVNAFGHVPARGERIELHGFNVRILRADKRRVLLLRFERAEKPEPDG